jgi:gluconate 2-dehydrogenase subunit 3-like protein
MDQPIELTVKGSRPGPPTRREAMQWVMGAVAASALPATALSQDAAPPKPPGRNVPQEEAAKQPDPNAIGYGTDPNLLKVYKPGEVWPLTFTAAQKQTAAVLADVILPKDDLGPAASDVGVVEMVDEWISAPYPQQQMDRPVIVDGLAWIDAESSKRFGKPFVEASAEQQREICDDLCYVGTAKPPFASAAKFFGRFRSLCAAAYYATPPGWEAIGYVGNVALQTFDGPPPEVLERLGVTQTVK